MCKSRDSFCTGVIVRARWFRTTNEVVNVLYETRKNDNLKCKGL